MWYHTLNMPPSCYSSLRVDFLGLRKKDSPTRSPTCSETDGRPECPFLWSQIHPLSIKFLCHFKMDFLVARSTLNLRLKARCTVTTLFVLWNSSTHQPRCCEVSANLHFTALWRRAGKLKFFSVNPLKTQLNLICHLLAILGAHPILHVSRIRINVSAVPYL